MVKLYDLPAIETTASGAAVVRCAMAYEMHIVMEWVRANFSKGWASECCVAFGNRPISCYIAVRRGEVVGFACYNGGVPWFLRPDWRGRKHAAPGSGSRVAALDAARHVAAGYAYAIVGGAGESEFYAQTVGAIEIPGSTPGIYRDRLKAPPS